MVGCTHAAEKNAISMSLCTLDEDPSHDLLPTGLTCKQLAAVCGARADRERSDGAPMWITSITSSVARVKWARAQLD